jgi:hypothetical protein
VLKTFALATASWPKASGGAAAAVGLRRTIYLGGLGHDPESEHLVSRQEVGTALACGGVPVVELRAAVVLGAGSISFEMLRYLTERLPFMVCPRWVRTAIQPIAAADMTRYLIGAIDVSPGVYDVGGADVTSYREMITAYATARGLRRRRIVDVPYLTPRLSSYWLDLVTPVDRRVSHALIESLVTEVVVENQGRTDAAFNIEPMGLAEALSAALDDQARELDHDLLSRQSGLRDGVYTMRVTAPPLEGRIDAPRRRSRTDRRKLQLVRPDVRVESACAPRSDRRGVLEAQLPTGARPRRHRRLVARRST